jgi:hypothetical protein
MQDREARHSPVTVIGLGLICQPVADGHSYAAMIEQFHKPSEVRA